MARRYILDVTTPSQVEKTNLEANRLGLDNDNYGTFLWWPHRHFYTYFPFVVTEQEWLEGIHEFSYRSENILVHEICGTEIESELMYSDSERDYYQAVCPNCRISVEIKQTYLRQQVKFYA